MSWSRWTVHSNLLLPETPMVPGIIEHMSFSCFKNLRCLSDKQVSLEGNDIGSDFEDIFFSALIECYPEADTCCKAERWFVKSKIHGRFALIDSCSFAWVYYLKNALDSLTHMFPLLLRTNTGKKTLQCSFMWQFWTDPTVFILIRWNDYERHGLQNLTWIPTIFFYF